MRPLLDPVPERRRQQRPIVDVYEEGQRAHPQRFAQVIDTGNGHGRPGGRAQQQIEVAAFMGAAVHPASEGTHLDARNVGSEQAPQQLGLFGRQFQLDRVTHRRSNIFCIVLA